eukprot:COSAG05_NODE_5667_length_1119_cov_1.051961_2_plen_71_part_00
MDLEALALLIGEEVPQNPYECIYFWNMSWAPTEGRAQVLILAVPDFEHGIHPMWQPQPPACQNVAPPCTG